MYIAICDDDRKWISQEEEYLDFLKDVEVSYEVFYSGEELIKYYQKNSRKFDIILLDMEMEDLNGINTANMIRNIDRHVIIIFITSHKKYVLESFECNPFSFLIKPVDFKVFEKTILKARDNIAEDRQSVVFKEDRNLIRLLYEEILFIQSVDHCVFVQTIDKTYKTYKRLSQFEKELSENVFVKVHKSYIINLNYVREISSKHISLRGYSHPITLSRTYKDTVIKKMFLFEERKHLS